MIDKTVDVKTFIRLNYTPGELNNTKKELQLSSKDILNLLFKVFPDNCIDDFDLHEILVSLGHTPKKRGCIDFVWCLKEK